MTWLQVLAPFLCFGPLVVAVWLVKLHRDKENNRPLPPGWVRNPNGTQTYHGVIRATHIIQDDGSLKLACPKDHDWEPCGLGSRCRRCGAEQYG